MPVEISRSRATRVGAFLIFREVAGISVWDIKTLWMQEMLVRGILSTTTHNISLAHGDAHVAKLRDAYDEVLPIIRELSKKVTSNLGCDVSRSNHYLSSDLARD